MVHPRLPCLKCGSILNILSWNLATFGSSRGDRDIKALQGMQDIYGTTPTGTVLMLQQLDAERLRQLLDDSWIQRNFKISNADPVKPKYTYPNMRQRRETAHSITSSPWSVTEWETPRDFSIMFFSNDLPVLNCFRIPFMAQQGKDLLFADLPVSSLLPSDKQNAVLRLCTSHHDFYYKDSDPDWPPETLLMSKLFDGNLTLRGDVAAGFQAVSTNMVHYDGHSPRMNGRPKHKDAWRKCRTPISSLKSAQPPRDRIATDGLAEQAHRRTWNPVVALSGSVDVLAEDDLPVNFGHLVRGGEIPTIDDPWGYRLRLQVRGFWIPTNRLLKEFRDRRGK